MTRQHSHRQDIYTRVTNRIIADLEQGVRPWMKPWNAEHAAGRINRLKWFSPSRHIVKQLASPARSRKSKPRSPS